MLKSKTMLETNKYELMIGIEKDKFLPAVDKAVTDVSRKAVIKGFRKGKAPRHLVEKMYGRQYFYGEALDATYPAAFEDAVASAGITVVGRPELTPGKMDEEGAEFKAVVWAKPDVAVENYKGIEVERPAAEVTDAEVNSDVDRTRDRNSRMISLEEGAKAENGNIAVIDFEGFVDGTAFKGGKAEKYELTLGSGAFIPGFEDQVVGHKAGDEFDVKVTFPKEYGSEELAGKDAIFKVKLHELKKKELPALDDEFVKDVSDKNTVAEYLASVRERIQKSKDAQADDAVDIAISDKLNSLLKADIPEVMIEDEIDEAVKEFDYRIRMQGTDLEKYLKYTGMNFEDFRKNFRGQAEGRVKNRLALEKITEIENIKIADEDVANEFKKMAENYGETVENLKKYVKEADLRSDLLVHKAVELVKSSAVIKQAKAEKKTAKITADKSEDKGSEKADVKPETKSAAKKPVAKKAEKTSEKAETDAEAPKAKKAASKKASPAKE